MASSEPISGANAEARLPTANVAISAMSTVRRGRETVSAGEQRCADDDAERVGRDEVAGLGHGDTEPGGDLRQQSHDHELGGADAEGADGEGEQRQAHGETSAVTTGPESVDKVGGEHGEVLSGSIQQRCDPEFNDSRHKSKNLRA